MNISFKQMEIRILYDLAVFNAPKSVTKYFDKELKEIIKKLEKVLKQYRL